MTTKLEAINTMLSCIGQAPLNTLQGTKSYFTISAENILNTETKRVQLEGWYFNTEKNYPLIPDNKNIIHVTDDILRIKFPNYRYVVRNKKVYDTYLHTFEIDKPLRAEVIFDLGFENLPEAAQSYIQISAAYKFVKREFSSEKPCIYTEEDVLEAKQTLIQHELEIGHYTMIPDYYNGNIRGDL